MSAVAGAEGIVIAIEIKPGAYGRRTVELWPRDISGELSCGAARRERRAAGWAWIAARRWLEKFAQDAPSPRPRAIPSPYDAWEVLIERLPESLIGELWALAAALRAMGFTVRLPAPAGGV